MRDLSSVVGGREAVGRVAGGERRGRLCELLGGEEARRLAAGEGGVGMMSWAGCGEGSGRGLVVVSSARLGAWLFVVRLCAGVREEGWDGRIC